MDVQGFTQFSDKLSEGMLLLSDQGDILAINRIACSLLQKSSLDLVSKNISLINELPKAEIAKRLKLCTRSRSPVSIELNLKHKATDTLLSCKGSLFTPATDTTEVQILIRVEKTSLLSKKFLDLNIEIESQKKLLHEVLQSRDELQLSKEKYQTTLNSIGDAVISTDTSGIIEYMNPIAEALTGFQLSEAMGQNLGMVFNIINESTRLKVDDPVTRCLREDRIVGLANHTILIDKMGLEIAIDDSAAPIRDLSGDIVGAVLVFHDVTQTRLMSAKLSHQASHDALTGLVNRYEFESRLKRLLSTTKVNLDEHALCYMDLDQFKIVNDTCGHTAGDELLKQISLVLKETVRHRDTLARLGGDEFGILMEHCSIEDANRVAMSVLKAVQEFLFPWEGAYFQNRGKYRRGAYYHAN